MDRPSRPSEVARLATSCATESSIIIESSCTSILRKPSDSTSPAEFSRIASNRDSNSLFPSATMPSENPFQPLNSYPMAPLASFDGMMSGTGIGSPSITSYSATTLPSTVKLTL